MSAPLMEFQSHVAGRNSNVQVFADRIEWAKNTLTKSVRRRDTNMIPIRQIQGVTTHRAGLLYTMVKVATASDAIEFRVNRSLADEIKSTISKLMLDDSPRPAAPSQAGASSVADELTKLVQLRNAGALTDDEFATQKAKLLS